MKALENTEAAEKVSGRKGRGRQREIMLEGLGHWHGGISSMELIHYTKDQNLGRDMNVNVISQVT